MGVRTRDPAEKAIASPTKARRSSDGIFGGLPTFRPVGEKRKSPAPAPLPAAAAAAAPLSKRAQSKSPTKRAASPKKSSLASDASTQGYEHHNVRGNIISPTSLPTIAALNQTNKFHETLPAPEVWHRRMPPYFTFGETPYMQKLASDQIQEDLNKSERTPLWFSLSLLYFASS